MHLHTEIWLPLARDRVFAFFSEAENLQILTPNWLRFEILSPRPIRMQRGTLIDYRIRLHGIPLRWRTDITTWDPPQMFVDTQVRGPYTTWVHTHRFSDREGGTLVEDDVEFNLLGGRMVLWYVARDLRRIFAYRHEALRQQLGLPAGVAPDVTIRARP
ncbi:MAG: SRPBCC family protein [Vicinamibacterales bacterium]